MFPDILDYIIRSCKLVNIIVRMKTQYSLHIESNSYRAFQLILFFSLTYDAVGTFHLPN